MLQRHIDVEHGQIEVEGCMAAEAIVVSVGENVAEHQSTKASAFSWLSMTPFGTPVDPEVYRM